MPIFDGTTSHRSGILGSLINWEGDVQFGENEFALRFLITVVLYVGATSPIRKSASLGRTVFGGGKFLAGTFRSRLVLSAERASALRQPTTNRTSSTAS